MPIKIHRKPPKAKSTKVKSTKVKSPITEPPKDYSKIQKSNIKGDDIFSDVKKPIKEPKEILTKDTVWNTFKLSQYIRQLFNKEDATKVKTPDSTAAPIYSSNLILKDWVIFKRDLDETAEYDKCKKDKSYFITKYCKLVDNSNYVVLPKFSSFIDNTNNKNIIYFNGKEKAEANDVTFLLLANLLWEVLFNNTRDCVVMFNTLEEEAKFIAKFVVIYSKIPHFLQRGVKSKSKHVIEMTSDCNIYCYHGKEFATIYFVPDLLVANDVSVLNDEDYDRFIRLDIPKMTKDNTTKLFATAGKVNFKGRFLEGSGVKVFDFS